MELPTFSDFNVYDSLDERAALKRFLGKSLLEAEQLFASCDGYLDHLTWMGPKAFCFYVIAASNYIMSDASTGLASSLESLEGALSFHITNHFQEIRHMFPFLKGIVKYILDNWDKFVEFPQLHKELKPSYVHIYGKINESCSLE